MLKDSQPIKQRKKGIVCKQEPKEHAHLPDAVYLSQVERKEQKPMTPKSYQKGNPIRNPRVNAAVRCKIASAQWFNIPILISLIP